MFKYQITLSNGGVVTCDNYSILDNGTLTYKNGTLEVMMKADMYDPESIDRFFIRKKD